MENQYAKEYYDTYLQGLETDYKSARWFSSPVAKLDYDQTKRVLVRALGDKKFSNTLEIGPGDGVWTDLILPRSDSLTLLDQSIEMLGRAKKRLKQFSHIEYVRSDFQEFNTDQTFDLIFAIRCFEYFDDKELAVDQLTSLLSPGGRLILVTKNPGHIKTTEVQKKELHKGQIAKSKMISLLKKHGFTVEQTISATWRLKAHFWPMRILFNGLHWLHTASGGWFKLPYITHRLTESYLYVAQKK